MGLQDYREAEQVSGRAGLSIAAAVSTARGDIAGYVRLLKWKPPRGDVVRRWTLNSIGIHCTLKAEQIATLDSFTIFWYNVCSTVQRERPKKHAERRYLAGEKSSLSPRYRPLP